MHEAPSVAANYFPLTLITKNYSFEAPRSFLPPDTASCALQVAGAVCERRYSEEQQLPQRELFAREKLIQMCRGSSISKARSRAEPMGTPTDDPTAPAAAPPPAQDQKSVRRPLWILLLLVLLISCRLIMALLSDPVPLRVPPSTEPRRRKVTLRSNPGVIRAAVPTR